jgi:hypothetical protein
VTISPTGVGGTNTAANDYFSVGGSVSSAGNYTANASSASGADSVPFKVVDPPPMKIENNLTANIGNPGDVLKTITFQSGVNPTFTFEVTPVAVGPLAAVTTTINQAVTNAGGSLSFPITLGALAAGNYLLVATMKVGGVQKAQSSQFFQV